MSEATIAARHFAELYMRCIWNEPLAEGLALAHQRDYAAAREKLAIGLVQSPESAEGHAAFAHTLSDIERYDDAVAAVRRALVLDPNHAPLHPPLGGLLRGGSDHAAAEQAVRQAVELNPFDQHFPGLLS